MVNCDWRVNSLGSLCLHFVRRGGGEYGREWRDAGSKANKQNVRLGFLRASEQASCEPAFAVQLRPPLVCDIAAARACVAQVDGRIEGQADAAN